MKSATHSLSYGATVVDGATEFRVWAPAQRNITLRLLDDETPQSSASTANYRDIAMQRDGQDFVATAAAPAGSRYRYILDDGLAVPDPVSRLLPEVVHGPTEIVDPAAFRWSDSGWRGLELRDYVIYELHIGTFTPAGTFDAA